MPQKNSVAHTSRRNVASLNAKKKGSGIEIMVFIFPP